MQDANCVDFPASASSTEPIEIGDGESPSRENPLRLGFLSHEPNCLHRPELALEVNERPDSEQRIPVYLKEERSLQDTESALTFLSDQSGEYDPLSKIATHDTPPGVLPLVMNEMSGMTECLTD
jgi:hypothetical protein